MPFVHLDQLTLITRPDALHELVDTLRNETTLAVDTESNSLYAYREQVCLLQISVPQADYMIDPLALEDLTPLGDLFSDPQIEKVFHAAEYDLICLRRDFGFKFRKLFDTMLAARILGRPEIGLGALLEQEFTVTLDKRYQRANWGQRPLPNDLLNYARLDTHYLIPLRDRMAAELSDRQLTDLAEEDFNRLQRNNFSSNGARQLDCWRIKGVTDLGPQQIAVLNELCQYRDQEARRLNRPLFKVFNDHILIAIAQATPNRLESMERLPGVSRNLVRQHGPALLDAVQRGLAAPPIYPPRNPRPDEGYLNRLEALRNWRKNTARSIGVASDVILPRDLMHVLAERNPTNWVDLATAMETTPWRRDHFGDQILNILSSL